MTAENRRSKRLLQLVGAMKRGEYPNARSLARDLARHPDSRLAACPRTLQRDIEHLQIDLGAPVEYDPSRRGYRLADPEWVFPLDELPGDLLYASLLGELLSLPLLPHPFRSDLETALKAQLAAADPDEVDAELLRAVVFATGATASLPANVFEAVHAAWRETRRLRILYETEGAATPTARDVDIHALFLAQGAWYARAYCHLRGDWRSLALHRIREAEPLESGFVRDNSALARSASATSSTTPPSALPPSSARPPRPASSPNANGSPASAPNGNPTAPSAWTSPKHPAPNCSGGSSPTPATSSCSSPPTSARKSASARRGWWTYMFWNNPPGRGNPNVHCRCRVPSSG